MNTRPRVGYIDLLETQIKTERNRGGRGEAGGPWPLAPWQPRGGSWFWSFLPWSPLPVGTKGTSFWGSLSQRGMGWGQSIGRGDHRYTEESRSRTGLSKCGRSNPVLAPPRAGPGPAGQERCWSGLELGHLALAAAADTGAYAAGTDAAGAHSSSAQSTRCDGIAGAAGCTHSGAHRQVPTAGGVAGTARHGPRARHTEVPTDDSTPGAADTCGPQSKSQNSDGELSHPSDAPPQVSLLDNSRSTQSHSCGLSCCLTPNPFCWNASPFIFRSP